MTGQLHPGRVAEARQHPDARCGRWLPHASNAPGYGPSRRTGSRMTPTTGRNQKVAVLPNLGKLHPTKSAGDARCRSSLAAAM